MTWVILVWTIGLVLGALVWIEVNATLSHLVIHTPLSRQLLEAVGLNIPFIGIVLALTARKRFLNYHKDRVKCFFSLEKDSQVVNLDRYAKRHEVAELRETFLLAGYFIKDSYVNDYSKGELSWKQ